MIIITFLVKSFLFYIGATFAASILNEKCVCIFLYECLLKWNASGKL